MLNLASCASDLDTRLLLGQLMLGGDRLLVPFLRKSEHSGGQGV